MEWDKHNTKQILHCTVNCTQVSQSQVNKMKFALYEKFKIKTNLSYDEMISRLNGATYQDCWVTEDTYDGYVTEKGIYYFSRKFYFARSGGSIIKIQVAPVKADDSCELFVSIRPGIISIISQILIFGVLTIVLISMIQCMVWGVSCPVGKNEVTYSIRFSDFKYLLGLYMFTYGIFWIGFRRCASKDHRFLQELLK